jgi:cbb3-type cytochrome oxidase subunit 3
MKSLADVVAAAGLAQYAEIALLLFFGVFIAITLRVLSANKGSLDRAAHLPLEDDTHVDR